MSRQAVIQDLRYRIGHVERTPSESWQAPCLSSGITKGILAELTGNAPTEWLMHFLKLHPETLVLWCETQSRLNPVKLKQVGLDLHRIKFANGFDDLQKPLRIALESGHYPFIIAPTPKREVKVFQRFSLLAQKTKSTVFFLSAKDLSQAWPISFQATINFNESSKNDASQLEDENLEGDDSQFIVEVHRYKNGVAL